MGMGFLGLGGKKTNKEKTNIGLNPLPMGQLVLFTVLEWTLSPKIYYMLKKGADDAVLCHDLSPSLVRMLDGGLLSRS